MCIRDRYPYAAAMREILRTARLVCTPAPISVVAYSSRTVSYTHLVVDYVTMPNPGQVWSYIGGWLYQAHLKEIEDNVPEQLRSYYTVSYTHLDVYKRQV